MPLYEYRCEACGEQFEVAQSVTVRAEDTVCPALSGEESHAAHVGFRVENRGGSQDGVCRDEGIQQAERADAQIQQAASRLRETRRPSPTGRNLRGIECLVAERGWEKEYKP